MVAARGFDDFMVMRVGIDLDATGALDRRLGLGGTHLTGSLARLAVVVEQGEDIRQRLTILGEQFAEFGFEFQLVLQFAVVLQGLQAGLQLFDGGLGGAVLIDQGHVHIPCKSLGRKC